MPDTYVPMYGNGSFATNSQLVASPMQQAFYPSLANLPFFKGSGQVPPTLPVSYVSSTTDQGVGGKVSAAISNPFSFFDSPLIIALAALVIGLLGLRYIHWR